MTQARIVLRDAALERGEQLLEVTRLGSLTELINVMFSRYGRHLEETWEVQPISPTYAKGEPLPEIETQAIASGSWTPVLEHLNEIMAWQDGKLHQAQKSKASADSLDGSSAGPDQTTDVNES